MLSLKHSVCTPKDIMYTIPHLQTRPTHSATTGSRKVLTTQQAASQIPSLKSQQPRLPTAWTCKAVDMSQATSRRKILPVYYREVLQKQHNTLQWKFKTAKSLFFKFFIILSVPHSFYLTHFPMLRGKRSHWMLQMWSFTMHTETSYANCLPQGNLHADQWRKPNIRVFEVTTARRTFRAGNCWPCSMLGWWGMCGKDVTSAC